MAWQLSWYGAVYTCKMSALMWVQQQHCLNMHMTSVSHYLGRAISATPASLRVPSQVYTQ